MNNFMFNVKHWQMNEFIKYTWQLIVTTSNATLQVPSLRPCILRSYFRVEVLTFAEWGTTLMVTC